MTVSVVCVEVCLDIIMQALIVYCELIKVCLNACGLGYSIMLCLAQSVRFDVAMQIV